MSDGLDFWCFAKKLNRLQYFAVRERLLFDLFHTFWEGDNLKRIAHKKNCFDGRDSCFPTVERDIFQRLATEESTLSLKLGS